ncbi:MAG TPA: hypothetical protein VGK87_09560 [Anaerolineae bacterium]|jgi:hypothetical protein
MFNRKLQAMTVPLLASMMVLSACDGGLSAPNVPPSPPVVAKASATVIPTPIVAATATPAVATVTAPTAAPSLKEPAKPSALFSAMQKFTAVKTYRAELEMRGKGWLGLSGDDTKPDPETVLFNLKGDFKGEEGHYTLKGFLTTLLGVDVAKGIEAMLVGDKAYVKGPIGLLGATEEKWYVLEPDQSEAVSPPFQVTDFLIALGNSNADLSSFKKGGTETVDAKKCDIYSGDTNEAKKAVAALNPGALPGVDDLSAVTAADIKFALCEDGYIHKILMTVTTLGKDKPDQKTDFTVSMRAYDYNANITITAPPDALPLKTIDSIDDTPTPTK